MVEEYAPRFRPRLIVAGVYPYGYSRMRDHYVLVDGQLFQESIIDKVEPVSGGFVITPFGRPALLAVDTWAREHFRFGSYLLRGANDAIDRVRRAIRRRGLFGAGSTPEQDALRLGPVLDEILAIREIAKSQEARFVVLLTSPQDGYGYFPEDDRRYSELILRFVSDENIPCYSPLAEMQSAASGQPVFRFRTDAHWNARAHEFAAEGLHRFLKETALAGGTDR
jgi:hypothetical protein